MVEIREMVDSVVDTKESDDMMENREIDNVFAETREISDVFVETGQMRDSVAETKEMDDKMLEIFKLSDNLEKSRGVNEMAEVHLPCTGSNDRKNVNVVDDFSEKTFTSEIKTLFLESHL